MTSKIRHNTQIHRQNYNSAITASPRDDVTVNGLQFFFLSPKRGELGGRIKPPRKGRIFCNNTMFHFICIQKYVGKKKNMDSNFRLIKEFDFKYRLANDLYFLCGYTLVEQA